MLTVKPTGQRENFIEAEKRQNLESQARYVSTL